jgi:hypothetical protein
MTELRAWGLDDPKEKCMPTARMKFVISGFMVDNNGAAVSCEEISVRIGKERVSALTALDGYFAVEVPLVRETPMDVKIRVLFPKKRSPRPRKRT